MQPVLALHDYKDLYHLLWALLGASQTAKTGPGETDDAPGVILWSQEKHSELLDSPDKLEVVERHARKIGLRIILSAASDPTLRQWGRAIGWTVMWELPSMDNEPGEKLAPGPKTGLAEDTGQGNF
jgi:hypothetical protein